MYAKVIQEVCDQSQVDFEEGGVDPGTLEKLKSVSSARQRWHDEQAATSYYEPVVSQSTCEPPWYLISSVQYECVAGMLAWKITGSSTGMRQCREACCGSGGNRWFLRETGAYESILIPA